MTDSKTTRRPLIAAEPGEMAFEVFYRREYQQIVAMARALLQDGGAAEDLAQESFLAAHRHWDRISRYDAPQAWVRRVMLNRAYSLRRRIGAELRALSRVGVERESQMPDLSPPTTEIWDQVGHLPRRQRQAVVLHYVGELSLNEVGEAMGCSTGAVKSHLHRARETLGRRLSDWNEV
ncbi:MAG: RNA polymerase sigma factor [Acidimicrobiia bacterium]